MIYTVHKSSYLISVSLNGLHSKLIDQKEPVQNSVLYKTSIASVTFIRLFSADGIAMKKKMRFLPVENSLTIWIYETFNSAKIVLKINTHYAFCIQKLPLVVTVMPFQLRGKTRYLPSCH